MVGKVAIVTPEFEGYLYAGYLIRLRFDLTKVNPYFISLFLSSPITRNHIELTARSTSGVNNINSVEVKSIPLVLPPLAEQHEIVRRVEALFALAERLESRWQAAHKCLSQLTPSLLAKAFRGDLVEQDLGDEPTEKMLERILELKESFPKENKKSQRRQDMKKTKLDNPISVIQALKNVGKELSSEQLFIEAGYPTDADSEMVEKFLVDIRDSLNNENIERKRRSNSDWFLLLK